MHLSEEVRRLTIRLQQITSPDGLSEVQLDTGFVYGFVLPPAHNGDYGSPLDRVGERILNSVKGLPPNGTTIIIGETIDLVEVALSLEKTLHYQLWISIKTRSTRNGETTHLPHNHFGALVYTGYSQTLQHTKTRIAYTYCPSCDLTTKDYGGKKHTYHSYGTAISDVWRDIPTDLDGDLSEIYVRFADLFGLDRYHTLMVFDYRDVDWPRVTPQVKEQDQDIHELAPNQVNNIFNLDCLEYLRGLPDNSVDFVFSDPPYNLKKRYLGYDDALEIESYFSWCDEWITECARILKPGRTLALLNIPLWSIRHFRHMRTVLQFQNWITWDALSYPVRQIMPAHYTILTFTKGESRQLPGLVNRTDKHLQPMAENFCLRERCIRWRRDRGINDRGELTDMWWDMHRLKHNTRRVDHPCQLPPNLMFRLISLYTSIGEIVLDPFNGAGTTTLTAHLSGRRYIGVELNEKYVAITRERHVEVTGGLDPFRKMRRTLTAKNSPVARMPQQTYAVPKKTLQLEVRRVAQMLGHIPNREELETHGQYPIRYYDEYFVSWGEVTAAARTTGMTETRPENKMNSVGQDAKQLSLDL